MANSKPLCESYATGTTPILNCFIQVTCLNERLEWFTDLRDELKAGNVETAVEAVEAAIKLLEKKR